MFTYPPIAASAGTAFREFDAHVFAKTDGRNTRWEWSRKRGWYKQGTRERLFDESDLEFGPAIAIFQETLADPVARVFRDNRWDRAVAFAEYHGERSLGGVLVPGDAMRLALFDVAVDDHLLDPREYVRQFAERDAIESADYLGRQRWTRGFVERVYRGEVAGASHEGVVGKGLRGEMAKAKSKLWFDAVRARYAPDLAEKIANS